MHQNGVYISAQGWIGIPRHQNVNNAGYGFWCPAPRLSGDFLAGLHSLFIGQSCRLEQRFTREFRREQKQRRAAFYFSTEFLGCVKCECFAGAVSHCNFALCVATKLAWVGACIPPGLPENTDDEEATQKLDLQLIMLYLVLVIFIYVPASLTPIQSLHDCKSFHSRRPTEHSVSQPQAQLIPHPSHNHSHHPSSTQQENVRRYTRMCMTLKYAYIIQLHEAVFIYGVEYSE